MMRKLSFKGLDYIIIWSMAAPIIATIAKSLKVI
jgi:hypothetical protein